MSILDDYGQLNIENFEGAISIGATKMEIATMFDKTYKEMDEWCKENYGRNFDTVYDIVRQITYREFLGVVKELGYRGNPSALNIINQALNQKATDSVVKIVFDNNIMLENEEDKEDDE